MDYTNIIKKNLIIMMKKNERNNPTLARQYKNTLLRLPLHPILSKDDLKDVESTLTIFNQMNKIMETNSDLEELEYFQNNLEYAK
jgi:hypothetical protein